MTELFPSKKVMIVEDNPLNQRIADMIIRQLGHETVQVFEGVKAMDVAKREKPDLIIMDINLPDISGTEVCKLLKADPDFKSIPIIVVTSLSGEDNKKQIVNESGCDNYIAKPFLPTDFAVVIGRYIPVKVVDWGD